MAFYYEKFGDVMLPQYSVEHDIGTGSVEIPAFTLTSGGSHVPPGRKTMQSATFNAAGEYIVDDVAEMRPLYLALRALIGTKDKLWRLWDDGTREWTWAWVREHSATQSVMTSPLSVEPSLSFFVEHPVWYSDDEVVITMTDFYDADDSDMLMMGVEGLAPGSDIPLTLVNNGYISVHDVTFTLTSGTGTVTTFDVSNTTTDYAFGWAGTLGAGVPLVVDTGAQAVTVGGVGKYDEFTPPANHAQWMELAPGENTVLIAIDDIAVDDVTSLEIRYHHTNA